MGAERGRLDVVSRLEHHGGTHLLSEPVVRNAEDHALGDRLVLEERGLHLGAVDVLSAAQQHVLGPVHDEDEAILVDAGDVARAEPAVLDGLRGGLGAIEIAVSRLTVCRRSIREPVALPTTFA